VRRPAQATQPQPRDFQGYGQRRQRRPEHCVPPRDPDPVAPHRSSLRCKTMQTDESPSVPNAETPWSHREPTGYRRESNVYQGKEVDRKLCGQCRIERVFLQFILLRSIYIGTDLPVGFYLQADPYLQLDPPWINVASPSLVSPATAWGKPFPRSGQPTAWG
jgi:hypothetical protein